MDSDATPAGRPSIGHTRDAGGHYVRSEAHILRDTEATRLRAKGFTYRQIAAELGYSSGGDAWRAVHRTVAAAVTDSAAQLIAVEAARLDKLAAAAEDILDQEHVAHSNGRVVVHDGQPLFDSGPKLAAIRELREIGREYRRLFGLDQPAKVDVSGGVTYELVGVDPDLLK